MKINPKNFDLNPAAPASRSAVVRPADAQCQRVRDEIEAEFGQLRDTRGQMVKLALNEAELAAWQTPFPHLVFPLLAKEKVLAVAAWVERQDALLHRSPTQSFDA